MTVMKENYSFLDKVLLKVDQGLAMFTGNIHSHRPYPPEATETVLSEKERKLAAGLMRVNHSGEVAAQGLYQGQAITAKNIDVKKQMEQSAAEENDHLAWCKERLNELDSHTSVLNPLWYAGSFAIGALAGIAGDKWSLGFVAETENQVLRHLESHEKILPQQDTRSREVIKQMHEDEAHHAEVAIKAGAAELPAPVKFAMRLVSKIMTKTAYYF